ncbi:MAG: aminotransferase class III-fold pyridoxal phosphate-dependent enzyme [Gammaproteobacteria bacterium]|nr:aminotransferase class III-fold pyridoxal phosphate-dependent enzyme [Gammaproteobacteria bacterium]
MRFELSSTARNAASAAGDVRASLRDDFGVDGTPVPLVGESDLNFRVDCEATTYIAKFSPEPSEAEAHRFRHALLAHIRSVDPALRVPRPVTARNGDDMVPVTANGQAGVLRVLTFVPGKPLRESERTPQTLGAIGRFMGRLSNAMQGFGHPAAHRDDFLWSLDNAATVAPWVRHIEPTDVRALAQRVFDRWHRRVEPRLASLPAMVVHHDANDDNLLVEGRSGNTCIGLVDFGDAVFARRVNELAVTLAYTLMGTADLSGAARAVIRGYTAEFPLTGEELAVLFDLVATRLAMSLCISSRRGEEAPDDAYFQVSRTQATELLHRLEAMNPDFAHRLARSAAGCPPVPSHDAVVSWLAANNHGFHSPFPFDLNTSPRFVVTLARDAPGTEYADDPVAYGNWLERCMQDSGARYAIGLYGERREVYTTGQFESAASDQRRSVHLGMDLFVPAGTTLHAPLAGTVVSVRDNDLPLDYGPTVILEHRCGDDGPPFWTLYGHLGRRSLTMTSAGDRIAAGQAIGEIGDHDVNGGWTPHLHFQLITDLLGETGNFNGAGEPANMDVWQAISPDPNLVLGLAPESFDTHAASVESLRMRREALLGPALSLSYRRKLHIVRGRGTWLYDHTGRAYLDGVNNIAHVGHCHPRVVRALHEQAARLNTNTRYLHANIVEYAERLLATLPGHLEVCWFVCSGSEANELALRLARHFTDREDLLVLDWAYHGNTGGLIDISPYKFKRRGGRGRKPHVHVAELPDPYRGPHKGYDESTARAYVQDVDRAIEACRARTGTGPAAMIAESMPGCGGQIVFPDRYLHHAFERVRRSGGVCIADEVQTGFGRVGDANWAFELQDAVPDIVTLGKPIGNGHPMAAVVTTREIADAFANGMEYFNSFGGNPVSCAVGLSVLDVMEAEGLRARARDTGALLMTQLKDMAHRHPVIGDVRGKGLYIGIELVNDRHTLEPATGIADRVVNLLREDGVLLSTDGPHDNVLKLKPPLAFGEAEAELFCRKLESALNGASGRGI